MMGDALVLAGPIVLIVSLLVLASRSALGSSRTRKIGDVVPESVELRTLEKLLSEEVDGRLAGLSRERQMIAQRHRLEDIESWLGCIHRNVKMFQEGARFALRDTEGKDKSEFGPEDTTANKVFEGAAECRLRLVRCRIQVRCCMVLTLIHWDLADSWIKATVTVCRKNVLEEYRQVTINMLALAERYGAHYRDNLLTNL